MSIFPTIGARELLQKHLGGQAGRVLRPFPCELLQYQIPLHIPVADQDFEVSDVVRIDESVFASKQRFRGRVIAADEEEGLVVPIDEGPPRDLEVRGREGSHFPPLHPSRGGGRIFDRLDLPSSKERGVNPVALQERFPFLPAPQALEDLRQKSVVNLVPTVDENPPLGIASPYQVSAELDVVEKALSDATSLDEVDRSFRSNAREVTPFTRQDVPTSEEEPDQCQKGGAKRAPQARWKSDRIGEPGHRTSQPKRKENEEESDVPKVEKSQRGPRGHDQNGREVQLSPTDEKKEEAHRHRQIE